MSVLAFRLVWQSLLFTSAYARLSDRLVSGDSVSVPVDLGITDL